MNLFANIPDTSHPHGATHEFDVELVDSGATNVYRVITESNREMFVETVVSPTGRELVDAILLAHTAHIREELDYGII